MARPRIKRGFRPIVVNGIHYRWRACNANRTADIEVHCELESSARGQRLCVYLAEPIPAEAVPFAGQYLHGTVVTPVAIAKLICDALSLGWQPLAAGEDFAICSRCH